MSNLYYFFILRNPGVTRDAVEKVLGEASDWFRYHDTCYVVQTTQSPKVWTAKLAPLVEPGGRSFVCKLDESHCWGWMSKEFWEWYQAKAHVTG